MRKIFFSIFTITFCLLFASAFAEDDSEAPLRPQVVIQRTTKDASNENPPEPKKLKKQKKKVDKTNHATLRPGQEDDEVILELDEKN